MAKRRCKYGRTTSGKKLCRKGPKGGGKGRKPSCKHGMLKNPTGRRRCKKR